MKVLLIDNYDSFVFNLAQYLGSLGAEPVVIRNDANLEHMKSLEPDAVVISPGPGRPEDAGVSIEAIRAFGPHIPLLGVCLGHQAIGAAFGARVVRSARILHGKTSLIHHDAVGVLEGLPNPFEAARYHSLVIDPGSIPEELEVTAKTDDGIVMAVRHRTHPLQGVQFHPESVMTPSGMLLLDNFVRQASTTLRP